MTTSQKGRTLDASANLESLKKEAKRWLKSLRDSDTASRARLLRVLPQAAANVGLRDVQHALALELGVSGWQALKEILADRQLAKRSASERADDFLRHAVDRQDGEISAQLLKKYPDIAHFSLHTAVVSGDVEAVRRRLAANPSAASETSGPQSWQPLQYLCYSRIPLAQTSAHAVEIARALLDAGADSNATFKDDWDNPFTLITGVIGEGEQQHFPHPYARELVSLLLERGADPFDTQSLYNTSLHNDDTTWLKVLYSNSKRIGSADRWLRPKYGPHPDNGMLDYLLGNAVSRNHLRRAEWLLEHGARAGTVHSYSRRRLHTEALLHGSLEMARLLEAHGAAPEPLTDAHAFQAACMRRDASAARDLLARNPSYLLDPTPLIVAADFDLVEVAEFLMQLGMSAQAGNGWSALHSAAYNGSLRVAKLLVEHGAEVDMREAKYNATPLGHALYARKSAMVDFLSEISRNPVGLISAGKLERLRAVLDEQPHLAREKVDGKSLLFFLTGPVDRAVEIAELLLARGADPTVRDAEGMTAGDIAAKCGVDELADFLHDAEQQRAAT